MKQPAIIGIYLAAGQSSRMGKNKLALPFGNSTLGSMALKAAIQSDLDHVVVVTKEADPLDWIDPDFYSAVMRERWSPIKCKQAGKGQAHSLKCGLQEGKRRRAGGIMVLLADQPFLAAEIINDLVSRYRHQPIENNRPCFVAASYQGIVRPPVLFSRQLFPLLMELKGDEGARKLFRQYFRQAGMIVEYDDNRAFFDIDSDKDYELVKEGDLA